MMKTTTQLLLCFTILFTSSKASAVSVTDPGGLGGTVNSGSYSLVEEAGNTSLSSFNALVSSPLFATYLFSIEDGDGYGTTGTLTDIDLTLGTSGIDLQTDLSFAGTGFSRTISTFRPTGGAQALAYAGTNTEAIFTFDKPVEGVGFTLNRFGTSSGMDIELYSDVGMTMQIGSTVPMIENVGVGSERSFFGYLGSDIRAVRMINGGIQQFGVDDFTVVFSVPVPEPGSAGLLFGGVVMLLRTRRRRGFRTQQKRSIMSSSTYS